MSQDEYRLMAQAVDTMSKMVRLVILVLGPLIIIEAILIVWVVSDARREQRECHIAEMECIARMCGGNVNHNQSVNVQRPLTNEDLILEQLRLTRGEK